MSHVGADGAVAIVVADVGSVFDPDVNVVEVAVMFQPALDPVASPTSIGCVAVTVWLTPVRAVDGNVTLGGVPTKPSEPAVSVALAVVAPAVETPATESFPSAPSSATAPTKRHFRLVVLIILILCGCSMVTVCGRVVTARKRGLGAARAITHPLNEVMRSRSSSAGRRAGREPATL